MRLAGSRVTTPGLTALLLALSATWSAAPAHAQLAATPCGSTGFLCGELVVPLDRSGTTPGDVRLSVKRLPAAAPSTEAVVALAGGPGQPALPIADSFAEVLAPLRATRDLLVFDQRGTGLSGALSCSVRGWPGTAAGVRGCAQQLGAARGSYRTIDSVEDIEALRVAGGYERLVLYGVSYGTKVALTYAARHPDRVAALVLDSVVPADGPDPFSRPAFAATGRVLGELCAGGACSGVTSSVTRDLRRAVRNLERRPLRGFVTSPRGARLVASLELPDLWDILLAGDLNPALRAELPGALRAMLTRDRAPILRLLARAAGLTGTAGDDERARARTTATATARIGSHLRAGALARSAAQSSETAISETLFTATRCEETPFPWTRGASARRKLSQAVAAARRLPSAPFAPFGRAVALGTGLFDLCAQWPMASAAPAPIGALPNVPTLVLDGAADLRTSAEQARSAVAGIPGARVAIIARSGHSVLGSDLGDCAAREVQAFASGTAPSCTPAENLFRPTPTPPPSLNDVAGSTKPRRTVNAVLATLDDVRRQLIGDAIAAQRPVTSGSRTAGLRGGSAVVQDTNANMSAVSYVPGVTVTGSYAFRGNGATQVRVGGPRAARGELTIGADGAITGSLGGQAIDIGASASSAGLRVRRWPEPRFPHPLLRALP